MTPVKIAAVADVHSPRFLHDFESALTHCKKPDLFLLAGDMINRGKVDEYENILDMIDSQLGLDFPILACFGNEEPVECHDEIRKITKGRIHFLDEKSQIISLVDSSIAVVGISGVKMTPSHNSRTTRDIQTVFEKRASQLESLLQEVSSDYLILLMHFSPLSESDPSRFSWWIENALKEKQPDLIIHGHIHDSEITKVQVGTTVVRNVALPVTRKITELIL